jgi:hypothetical protein
MHFSHSDRSFRCRHHRLCQSQPRTCLTISRRSCTFCRCSVIASVRSELQWTCCSSSGSISTCFCSSSSTFALRTCSYSFKSCVTFPSTPSCGSLRSIHQLCTLLSILQSLCAIHQTFPLLNKKKPFRSCAIMINKKYFL